MLDMDLAFKNVSAFCRGTGKLLGVASWRPFSLDRVGGDLGDALRGLPLQGGSDELHFVLGKREGGYSYDRMEKMPHLLVAGTTGSGKSVFINSLLVSLLSRHTPSTLQLGLVDPKQVEFACYGTLPHLVGGGVATSVFEAIPIIDWAVDEMERRLHILTSARVKDLSSYNASVSDSRKLSRVVLVIDEFADIILGAVTKEEKEAVKRFEVGLTRLAQKARAAGIHLVLSTQKPITKVVTTVLKGNIPARVAFRVSNATDSRVILDEGGADLLGGRGEMLFKSPYGGSPVKLRGVWVPDVDIYNHIEGD